MLTVRTPRLDLVAATIALLDAEMESPLRLASLLGAVVPEGWPPGEYDRPAIEFFRARLAEHPDAEGWYAWYAIRRPENDEPAMLAGAGGYFGPPSPDGIVEIGYSILPGFRGRGFAGELVRALVSRAFAAHGVHGAIAHTHQGNIGSVKVLERAGFVLIGPGKADGTVQYARMRGPVAPDA